MNYRDQFIGDYADIALEIGRQTGIAPEVVLAQAAHESRWGQSGLSTKHNNMFGMKGSYQGMSATLPTREVVNGRSVMKNEAFRAYPTPEESFRNWGDIMNTGKLGANVRATKPGDVKAQIAALASGPYATEFDKAYKSALSRNVEAIRQSDVFQKAYKEFTGSLVGEMAGLPEVPSELDLGIAPAVGNVDTAALPPDPLLAPPDLPGALTGLPQPAQEAGFSLPDVGLPDFAGIGTDLTRAGTETALSNMRADMFDRGFYGPGELPSVPDVMSQMDGPSYPDITAGVFPGPSDFSVSVPDVGPLSGLDVYGPTAAPDGFHAGVDGFAPTPDFSAPSLNERAAFQSVSDPHVNHSFDGEMAGLNGALMAELSRPSPQQAFDRVSVPETYTSYETRTKEVPFSQPNSLQNAYAGDWEDKLGAPLPGMPSTRTITERVPVQQTRMVEKVVPRALPSLPTPIEIAPSPISPSFDMPAPRSPGAFNSFTDYMSALGRGQADLPGGYNSAWAQTAFGDGPYATVAHDDLQKATAKDFGTQPVGNIYDAFNKDWGSLSPTAQGAIKGGLFGGPLGMVAGGAIGYGKSALSDLFGGFSLSDLFGGGNGPGSSFGGFNISDVTLGPDAFSGGFDFGGGGVFGGDPSQDGGARYT